jgi:SAM-dependent methyltransferase
MDIDRVRAYYANLGEREWSRLDAPSGALEFAVNARTIQRYLPRSARILDVGGGPGRYTIWLAGLGHRVVLADLSAELLAVAEARIRSSQFTSRIEASVEADVRDLSSWQEDEFDAALCLGPFYHLTERSDRERAASELRRVVRPGGKVFVAFMPRYAFLRRTAAISQERHRLLDPLFVERLLRDGVFLNDQPGRFDVGFGVRPSEIAPFFERQGFDTIEVLASEGLGSGIEDAVADLRETDPATYERLMNIIMECAADPSVHGLTTHLLYVGAVK